ncbi:hypothetical protein DL93DRAFT_1565250 [Clavulina sp. PMI_390]|nr:hypothetical protein DL93DRAFT_1565250 [Clavulina sp. PMI_390]
MWTLLHSSDSPGLVSIQKVFIIYTDGIVQVSTAMHTSILTNRSLWHYVVRRQLYMELIPETTLPLSEMSASSLFLCATRKRRISQAMFSSRPLPCRRVDVHLTTPLGFSIPAPRPNAWLAGSICAPMLIPGGRYFLGIFLGSKQSIVCCWDLHSSLSGDGTIRPSASLTLESVNKSKHVNWAYPPGSSPQDETYNFAIQTEFEDVHVIQLRFPTSDTLSLTVVGVLRHREEFTLKSIVGDWVSLATPLGRAHFRIWDWKTNVIGSHSSWPRCLTPLGRLVITSTAVSPSTDGRTLDVTIKLLAMKPKATHLRPDPTPSRQQHQPPLEGKPETLSTHKLKLLGSSKFPLLKTDATRRMGIYMPPPPNMTSTPALHRLDESLLVLETYSTSSGALPASALFSIASDSHLTCLQSDVGELGGNAIPRAILAEWLPGLWKWQGPRPQDQTINEDRVATSPVAKPFQRIKSFLAQNRRSSSFTSSKLGAVGTKSTSPLGKLPCPAPRPEPQELESTRSLETSSKWTITAKPMGIGSVDPPTAVFSARTYDSDFRGSTLISFCPRSGIWAYQVPMPSVDALPHAPLASGAYVSFALIIFD